MSVEYAQARAWPVHHLAAAVRGLALAGVAVTGFLLFVANVLSATLCVVGLLPLHLATQRGAMWLANRARGLARAWGGVEISEPYRGEPPQPVRRADGWYEYNNRLYKSRRYPTFMLRYHWTSQDPAVVRDALWMLTNSAVGLVLGLLPAAVVAYGLTAVAAGLASGGLLAGAAYLFPASAGAALLAPAGVLLAVAGFWAAPAAVRLHARWTAVLLAPGHCGFGQTRGGRFLLTRGRALGHALVLAVLSVAALCVFLWHLGTVVTLGWFFRRVVETTRPGLNTLRERVHAWSGISIPRPYLPEPDAPVPDANGMYRYGRQLHRSPGPVVAARRNRWIVTDPATWRDLLWGLVSPVVGVVVALAPAAAAVVAFFGMTWPWVWMTPIAPVTGYFDGPFWGWRWLVQVAPVLDLPGARLWLGFPLGLAVVLTVIAAGPVMLRVQARFARLLLAPTAGAGQERLAQRVEQLERSRADATDVEAAELRRIERDLHDGAQARLVSMGMKLGAVERLVDTDPTAAKTLLADVREGSSEALTELRDLIRGIHPPVLSERGLGDAVQALALDSPLVVDVAVQLGHRLPAPVESAAYFAVAELLTNAARHSGAGTARVDLQHGGNGELRVTVTDDGHGNASPSRGSGLRGIERRMGTFDGKLHLDSPPGGPTTATITVPRVPAAIDNAK